MDIQTASISAVKWLGCFGYKPDWIKYLDSTTGLGSDGVTQWRYWTRIRLQNLRCVLH